MKDKFLTICIDVEDFGLPNEFGASLSKDKTYRISLQGLDLLCEVLNEFNIKVTFFVTDDIAMVFPEKVRSLAVDGHEIALHSVLQDYKREEIRQGLKKQKSIVENIIEAKTFGHRSHKLLPISLKELKELGFLYDNSLHPTFVPGRYCNIFSRRELYKEYDMFEVPVTVTPLLRFPFSWFWFRFFGVAYVKLCSKLTYLTQEYINIYFHCWDFGNITNITLKWPYKLLLHNLGDKMVINFRHFLNRVKMDNISVITMLEYLQNQNHLAKGDIDRPINGVGLGEVGKG